MIPSRRVPGTEFDLPLMFQWVFRFEGEQRVDPIHCVLRNGFHLIMRNSGGLIVAGESGTGASQMDLLDRSVPAC